MVLLAHLRAAAAVLLSDPRCCEPSAFAPKDLAMLSKQNMKNIQAFASKKTAMPRKENDENMHICYETLRNIG
jgi:hypothetical protein